MKNITTKKPVFDLSRSGHALAAIGQEFPLQLIDADPRTALITLAFLFSNSNALRCQNYGLATSQLALFAAAPFAGIDAEHYQELRRVVAEYRNYCLQLDGEAQRHSDVHVNTSIDQADGFADDAQTVGKSKADSDAQALGQSQAESDAHIISDFQRMICMLTFILTASEAVYELEAVKRSVQKQLRTKSRPSSNSRRSNVFAIELPETTASVRAEVIALLEAAGWAPERLSDSVFEVRGRRNAGLEVERQKSNGADTATTLAGGEPDGQK